MNRGQQRVIRQMWRDYRERGRGRRSRDELMRLTPTRVQLFWGALGLLVGIVATVIVLIIVAPQPAAVATSPSTNSDVAITLDDTALTNLTAAGIAQANLPFTITNVQAHIMPNNVVQMTGDIPLVGGLVTRQLSATAVVDAEQGHVVLHIQQASLGDFGLPGVVTTAIESVFNQQSAKLTGSLNVNSTHYDVSGISSSINHLTFKLRRVP